MGAISGVFSFDDLNYSESLLKKFQLTLSHRMSNIEKYFSNNYLFIQEQGIFSNDELIINFDGALYNKEYLEKKYDFSSNTFSELIAKLYKKCGKSFFKELEGSFVFSIYDKLNGIFYLIRDQLGEKAVYYNFKNKRLAYSSEIKGILELNDVKRELNISSMEKYFIFSYVPGEETMIKDIYELLPAYYLEFKENQLNKIQYWDLTENINNPINDENELIDKLKYLLNDSVKKRMPDNENIGLFLSGGIDSSLISAIAQNHRKDKINTYSIHFGKEYPNELYYSSMVAEHIKSNHEIVEIKPKNFLNDMFNIIKCLDDPIGDPITVPNFLLASIASKNNKIVLNGEGGDPLFGGPKNIPMVLSHFYSNGEDEFEIEKYYLKSYKKCYDIINSFFSDNILNELKKMEKPEVFINGYLKNIHTESLLQKLMFLNTKLKGTHHILVKVDKMTSANKINAIAPIFSPDISQFSFQILPEMKLNGRIEKYILKKAVEDILPNEVVYREKKGMMVPVKFWFQKDLKKYAKKILSKKSINEKGHFNYEFIKKLINYNLDEHQKSHMGLKLWMIITFEIWHKIFIENENID
jgi:asparagine synthase (glutamine-hydrolysing)